MNHVGLKYTESYVQLAVLKVKINRGICLHLRNVCHQSTVKYQNLFKHKD